ncbi:hypothetical protein L3X38_003659 [Prunus dulcis]|uniref:Uncharacterized protein n=1 Tax=Prunus dulcis TaxID=3755 RepID=A0AAD4ZMH0_PRUDU|nr:hypothetical protein L3X38_003659 [Prunus dulcis]
MFTLQAAVLWTVNDFPAYAMVYGWSIKGYMACLVCKEDVTSGWHAGKVCYPVLITVDDVCYVHALLLLLVPMPCIVVVGTSIVTPACYGAKIVAHVFAGFLCSALPIAVLTGFLCSALSAAMLTRFLCSALPIALLIGFLCSTLSAALLTGFLCYALPIAVLTGFLCSASALLTGFLCSAMCLIF